MIALFDVRHHHAVVVDHDDARDRLEDFLALDKRHRVRIHDDQERALRAQVHRLLRRDEHILILRLVLKRVDEARRQRATPFDDDVRAAFEALRDRRPHADRRTDAVEVGIRVAHDEHAVARLDVVGKRGRDNARAHLVALFHALGEAAEELVCTALHADGHLVAAAAERHIERMARVHLALRGRFGAAPDADGDRGRHVVFALNRAHAVEHGEALRLGLLHMLLVGDQQIAPVRHSAQEAAHRVGSPVAQDRLHLGGDTRILAAVGVARHLLAVVERDPRHDRAPLPVLPVNLLVVGVVDEIDDASAAGAQPVRRKFAVAERDGRTAFRENLAQRFRVDVGGDVVAAPVRVLGEELAEARVRPHDVAHVAEHRHRQRELVEVPLFLGGEHPARSAQRRLNMDAIVQVRDDDRNRREHGDRQLHRKQNLVLPKAQAGHDEHGGRHRIIHRRGRPDAPFSHTPLSPFFR